MKKILSILTLALIMASPQAVLRAQEEEVSPPDSATEITYEEDALILDSDLDGLTDQGEIQKFGTDPQAPDSDSDGFLDGAEVLEGTDPLDSLSPSATTFIKETVHVSPQKSETPWAWYVTRSAGLVGFLLLYMSMVLGLSIRIPGLNKIIQPIYSLEIHCWISAQALFLVLVHGLALLFDKYMSFNLGDIFIPFHSDFHPLWLSAGIISFYLMIVVVVSSYGKKFISQKVWRIIHWLNMVLYATGAIHALKLGTDMKYVWVKNTFLMMNAILVGLVVTNLTVRVYRMIRAKQASTQAEPEKS